MYTWTPSSFLTSTVIASPQVVTPTRTTRYRLAVTGANGCRSFDTVTITVLPPAKLFAGNDTSIVTGQALPLFARDVNGTGFTQFSWSPSLALNNDHVQNPVATPGSSIIYHVDAATIEGCAGSDDIEIKVFKNADIFIPLHLRRTMTV